MSLSALVQRQTAGRVRRPCLVDTEFRKFWTNVLRPLVEKVRNWIARRPRLWSIQSLKLEAYFPRSDDLDVYSVAHAKVCNTLCTVRSFNVITVCIDSNSVVCIFSHCVKCGEKRAYSREQRLSPLTTTYPLLQSWNALRSDVTSEDTMSFEEEDCFQSWVDGGIFRSQLQWKSFLRFEGEAQIVGEVWS